MVIKTREESSRRPCYCKGGESLLRRGQLDRRMSERSEGMEKCEVTEWAVARSRPEGGNVLGTERIARRLGSWALGAGERIKKDSWEHTRLC